MQIHARLGYMVYLFFPHLLFPLPSFSSTADLMYRSSQRKILMYVYEVLPWKPFVHYFVVYVQLIAVIQTSID